MIRNKVACKKCKGFQVTKSGTVRSRARFKCADCNLHFVLGDRRRILGIEGRYRAVQFCRMNVSLGAIAYMFNVSRSSLRSWNKQTLLIPSLSTDEIDSVYLRLWATRRRKKYNGKLLICPAKAHKIQFAITMLKDNINNLSKVPGNRGENHNSPHALES